jgi:tRNA A37 threonylcarbamoyladenosine biosynthesis protein TsaE
LIEWPEILGDSISPTKKIYIEIIENEKRKITITQI